MDDTTRIVLWSGVAAGGTISVYKLLVKPSAHFTYDELQTTSHSVKNVAGFFPRICLILLCQFLLEKIRALAGGVAVYVNSAFRSSDLQDELVEEGQTTTTKSDHELGLAADIEIPSFGSPSDVMRLLWDYRDELPIKQAILEYDPDTGEETHVHVALDVNHLLDPAKAKHDFRYTKNRVDYFAWSP